MAYKGDQTFHTASIVGISMEISRLLGETIRGRATGGTTTTLVDAGTGILSADLTTFADDHFNGGTLWLIKDAAEAAAEPEERLRRVSDFVGSTGTVTINTSWSASASAESGDTYAISTSKYPMHKIFDAINGALQDIGPLPYTDTTTLDTIASQTEYTLPVTTNMDLRKVWIQGRTNDANDNRWVEVRGWDVIYPLITADTADDILVLPFQYPSGRDIRLDYVQVQSPVYGERDHIHSKIHPSLIAYEAAVRLLEWREASAGNDPSVGIQLARWTEIRGADGLTKIERIRARHTIETPAKHSRLLILGRRVAEDQFTFPGP